MKATKQEPIPIALRDCSYPAAQRKLIDVVYPEGALSDEELVAYSTQALAWAAKYGDANAFCIFVWRSRADIGIQRAVASAEWAPYGRWEDAHLAKLGEYDRHQWHVVFNDTEADA